MQERSEDFQKQLEFRKVKSNKNLGRDEELNKIEEEENGVDYEEEYYSDLEKKFLAGRFILEKKQQFVIKGKITVCDLNKKSEIIVFGLDTGIFCIYDVNTFENKYTLQISEKNINSISISNNGLWLAFGSRTDGQLIVWEWKSESFIFKQQGHYFDVNCIAFSPDSSLLTSGGSDGKIKVWDVLNTTCLVTFNEHTSKVTDLKFVPNKGNTLVSTSLDGTVRAYDLVKNRNFRIMTTPSPCQLLCVTVDFSGEIVCAGSMDPYSIYVWSLKTGDLIDILGGHTGIK